MLNSSFRNYETLHSYFTKFVSILLCYQEYADTLNVTRVYTFWPTSKALNTGLGKVEVAVLNQLC